MADKVWIDNCEACGKPPRLCLCAESPKLKSRARVMILQHPQEPDRLLGTARLAQIALGDSADLRVGLSWPNLTKALGEEAGGPARWLVLYLGSGVHGEPQEKPAKLPALIPVDSKGIPFPDGRDKLRAAVGIVILDGTWSQAKALWWRNAWLLKLTRVVLVPAKKSRYGNLRKEPRAECLSTIETIGASLTALGESMNTEKELDALFAKLLERYRASHPSGGGRDRRRRR